MLEGTQPILNVKRRKKWNIYFWLLQKEDKLRVCIEEVCANLYIQFNFIFYSSKSLWKSFHDSFHVERL